MNDIAKFVSSNQKTAFIVILFIGIFLRFYNLNWGAPYYFHPDEKQNIAYPIQESKSLLMREQKNFDINPFPLIVIKNTYQLVSKISRTHLNPIDAIILISRFYSASLSIIISMLLFIIGKRFWNRTIGIIAFTLSIFSTGLIQYAHFGTIEVWEGLSLLLIFYLSAEIIKTKKVIYFLFLSIAFGIGVATKFLVLSALPIVLIPFIPIFIAVIKKRNKKDIVKLCRSLYIFAIGFISTTIIFFPQLFLRFKQIEDSLRFESTVATGKLPVFFTQGFANTTPLLYQIEKVLPFLLNPSVLLLSIYALIYLSYKTVKKRDGYLFLLLLSFLIPFSATSLLFVKWTRYMIPLIPFLYIIVAVFLYDIFEKIKDVGKRKLIILIPVLSSILFSVSFFITAYLYPHTTVSASSWFQAHYKHADSALAESYDIGITPFNSLVKEINFIDFYSIDNDEKMYENLELKLQTSEFIILPSQRILKSRIHNLKSFPRGFAFYNKLLHNKSNFKLVYKTSCNLLCQMAYVGDPIFANEETITVFDRPTVFIFKKIN